MPWEDRPDSIGDRFLCRNTLHELVFVCSVSHWVVWFSNKVSWERKHAVLQFPVCGPDSGLVCECVCVVDVLLTCFFEGSHVSLEHDTYRKIMSSLSREQQG